MPTTSPEAAMLTALSTYLRSKLQTYINPATGLADLSDSDVVDEWPEPTVDLELGQKRVIVAVTRGGKPTPIERIGGPRRARITPGVAPAGVVRFEYGQIDQPIALGLYAHSRELRDDVDLVINELVNMPFSSTVPLVAPTTLSVAIAKTGRQVITPAAMGDLDEGMKVRLNVTGVLSEIVTIEELHPRGFIATTTKTHLAGVPVAQVVGRRETAACGLSLRCASHFNGIAGFDFEESVQTLDDAEGGRGSQRQEWRSIRLGTGSLLWCRDVNAVLQQNAFVAVHGTTTGGELPDPKTVQSF